MNQMRLAIGLILTGLYSLAIAQSATAQSNASQQPALANQVTSTSVTQPTSGSQSGITSQTANASTQNTPPNQPVQALPAPAIAGNQATLNGAIPAPQQAQPLSQLPQPKDNYELLKDAIAANNQTVSHVSGIFQAFGWWIGILITILGAGAGIGGWFAFKSLHELNAEHQKRLKKAEAQWQEEWKSFQAKATRELESLVENARKQADAAESSARQAEKHAAAIENSRGILNQALIDIDALQGKHRAVVAGHCSVNTPLTGTTSSPPVDKTEEPTEEEAEQIKAGLKGKLGTSDDKATS